MATIFSFEFFVFFRTLFRKPYLLLLGLTTGLSELTFAFHIGVIGGAVIYIKEEFQINSEDTLYFDAVTHCLTATAVIGAFGGGYLADKFGRKSLISAAAGFSVLGSLVTALAPTEPLILVGRLLVGLSVGVLYSISSIYLTEGSPASIRGGLMIINSVFRPVGRFVANLVISICPTVPYTWRYMVGVGVLISSIQFLLSLMLSETPIFSVKQGRIDEARKGLNRIYATEEVELQLENLISFVRAQDNEKVALHTKRKLKRGIFVGSALQVIQNLAGMQLILFFSPTILQIAGFTSEHTATYISVAVASCTLVGSLIALSISYGIQRKSMLLISLYLALLGHIFLGFIFYKAEGCESNGKWAGCPTIQGILALTIASVLFVFSFPTLGTVPVLITVEVQPFKHRGIGTGVAEAVGFTANFALSATSTFVLQKLKSFGGFWLYASFTACSLGMLHLIELPATTGLPLEQIEEAAASQN